MTTQALLTHWIIKYGSIEALNRAWGTNYTAFDFRPKPIPPPWRFDWY